jgi:hypothetical protein
LGAREYRVSTTTAPFIGVFPGLIVVAFEPVSEKVNRKLSLFQLDVHTGEID